jgi:putative endonuclease
MSVHTNYKIYYVYILASGPRGTLYIGVTKDLIKRVYEHRQGIGSEFTKKYSVHRLVYYEDTTDIEVAIAREKQLKKWNREWKIELIISMNPQWKDLYEDIYVNS